MALNREYTRLLYKIAQNYYIDGLTQQQIAKRLGLSRPKISRLLKRARRERIVTISIIPPQGEITELEHKLEHKFGLEEVIVVPVTHSGDLIAVSRHLGPAAAECLIRRISGKEIVGITWGSTMMDVVDALPYLSFPNLTIVQMNGGLGPVENIEHSAELTRRAAQKFGAKHRLLSAPGIASNRRSALAFKSDKQIKDTLELAAHSNMAMVGLGVPSDNSVLMRDGSILTKAEVTAIKKAGGVGDIALHYVDANGKPVELDIHKRIIGLSLDAIKKIPCVIAVAGGKTKYKVIRAALLNHILNVLVTDNYTAKKLLQERN